MTPQRKKKESPSEYWRFGDELDLSDSKVRADIVSRKSSSLDIWLPQEVTEYIAKFAGKNQQLIIVETEKEPVRYFINGILAYEGENA